MRALLTCGKNIFTRGLLRSTFLRSTGKLMMADFPNHRGFPLQEVVDKLNGFAPKALSESWDNTGILIEPYTPRIVKSILLTNDLTEDVMTEAMNINVEMIIAYHPPIFTPLMSVTQRSWKERVVSQCLERGIAVYSPHTTWDVVLGGVNDWLASALPPHSRAPITPRLPAEDCDAGTGSGRLCVLDHTMSLSEAVERVKKHCGLSHVRLARARGATDASLVSHVAVCAGSGASLLRGVVAQLYLTGEMLHHDILEAVHNNTSVIMTNHSDSERGFLAEFQPKLTALLQNQVDVILSKMDRDPISTV